MFSHRCSKSLRALEGELAAFHSGAALATPAGFPTTWPLTKPGCPNPGCRIVYLYTEKVGKAPNLHAVCSRADFEVFVRPKVLMRLSETKKRQQGSGRVCRVWPDRIERAFLMQEQKIVVKVLTAK
ncbi:PREDICTED: 60S ribosomal protein L34-like [Chinchilla lanigera]|uniref:60S ribosomal protein L34-like n=1 Tax=Chinchilla lanigera TaxID=34839 RepID=UPI0006982C74|nr:PREDICTED: 60S ribosomal protein L34-like [Chinchilla lanigera]